MNIHPLEITLTRKLLKEAQEFRPLHPLPAASATAATHPALLIEMLPLIQRTASEWVPELTQKIVEMADLYGAKLPVPVQEIATGLQMWSQHPSHQRTPVYVAQPSPAFLASLRPQESIYDYQPTPAEIQRATDWENQLRKYERIKNPEYYITPATEHLERLLDPISVGSTKGQAVLVPSRMTLSGQPLSVLKYPSVMLKLNPAWAETYVHELGHSLLPHVPLYFGSEALPEGKFLNVEATNAALMRLLASAVPSQVAQERPTPFTAQTLGQLFGQILRDYGRYMTILQSLETSPIATKVTPEIAQTALSPFRASDVKGDPDWVRLFEDAFQAEAAERQTENPEIFARRQNFIHALNKLLALSGSKEGGRRLADANIVDILKLLQRLRGNPATRALYDIALYGPRSEAEARQVIESAIARSPAAKHTPAYKILQQVTEPSIFRYTK